MIWTEKRKNIGTEQYVQNVHFDFKSNKVYLYFELMFVKIFILLYSKIHIIL